MLLTDARRSARTTAEGDLVPLADQDRTLWNWPKIDEGVRLLQAAMSNQALGPYQLQASIAAIHDEAPSASATDWVEILALYRLLGRFMPNPMVWLNEAVATAMVLGPAAGLALLEQATRDGRLAANHRADAVRGHLLEMLGDGDGAATAYRRAARMTTSSGERRYLERKAAAQSPNGPRP
jgi:predicted RNA polymerase sigma factor